MAKKTSKKTKTAPPKKKPAAPKKPAAKKPAAAPAKKPPVERSDDRKKRTTARSSANAAAVALAAVRQYHSNGNGSSDDEAVAWTDEQLRKVKTGLKKKDYDHFRQLLMEKRAEILGDVASLKEANSGGAGNLSNMPLHMADVGSDNYEQEFALGLVEWERKLLNEIDRAIERIDAGTYGVCRQSGVPIPVERLEIKPWAKYTIEVVRERERRGLAT